MKVLRGPFPQRQFTLIRIANLCHKQRNLEESILQTVETLKLRNPEISLDTFNGSYSILKKRIGEKLKDSEKEGDKRLSQKYLVEVVDQIEYAIEQLKKIDSEVIIELKKENDGAASEGLKLLKKVNEKIQENPVKNPSKIQRFLLWLHEKDKPLF